MVPGPVRVALVVDAGIAGVYGLTRVLGLPDGRLGGAIVTAQAVVFAAVVLSWAFPAFWSAWVALVERQMPVETDGPPRARAPLPGRPSSGSMLVAGAVLSVLVVLQVAFAGSGAHEGMGFRTVVNAFAMALGLGAVSLAVVADVRWMLAATAAESDTSDRA